MKKLFIGLAVLFSVTAQAQVSVWGLPRFVGRSDSARVHVSEMLNGRLYNRSLRLDSLPGTVGGGTGGVAQTYVDSLNHTVSNKGKANRAKLVIMFDDGYRSNYTLAFPLFKKYGARATVAVEPEHIGLFYAPYNTQMLYPADLREMVKAGWEIASHPKLTLSAREDSMVAGLKRETVLIGKYLTGESFPNADGSITTGLPVSDPFFTDYKIRSAVIRGGARTDSSDKAMRYVFDKFRTINGPASTRGNHLWSFSEADRHTQMTSAYTLDEGLVTHGTVLAFINSIANTSGSGILYAHNVTPIGTQGNGSTSPWVEVGFLDTVLHLCSDLGIEIIPYRELYKGQLLDNPVFDTQDNWLSVPSVSGTDTADWTSAKILNGGTQSIKIVTNGFHSGNSSYRVRSQTLSLEPYTKYRITTRYRIDTALVRNGTTADIGLNVSLNTVTANVTSDLLFSDYSADKALSSGIARPYQATPGIWASDTADLITGSGNAGYITLYVKSAKGVVYIGEIGMERLESVAAFKTAKMTWDENNGIVDIGKTGNTALSYQLNVGNDSTKSRIAGIKTKNQSHAGYVAMESTGTVARNIYKDSLGTVWTAGIGLSTVTPNSLYNGTFNISQSKAGTITPAITIDSVNQNIALGNVLPDANKLTVNGSVKINSIPNGLTTDSILLSSNGQIRKVSSSAFSSGTVLTADSATFASNYDVDTAKTNIRFATRPAYTVRANNTNATATPTDQTFKYEGEQPYVGTITWTAGTAPSGTANNTYDMSIIGNRVTISFTFVYSVAGATVTNLQFPLPTGVPQPKEPAGIATTNYFMNYGIAYASTSPSTIATAQRVAFRRDAGGVYTVYTATSSASLTVFYISLTYFTT